MDEAPTVVEDVQSSTEQTTTTVESPKAEVPPEMKKALNKANKEAETLRLRLKEFEDRDKSELQLLQEERDALKAKTATLELEQMRREVADEKGLTPAQARRLVGSTREEMESDADEILEAFPTTQAPRVFGDVGQGVRPDTAQRVYTTAELNDFAFFQKHKDDILLAQREGRIQSE